MSSLDTSSSLSTGISLVSEEKHSHLETHEVISENEVSDQDSEELVTTSDEDLLNQNYQFAEQNCHISKEIEGEELAQETHSLNRKSVYYSLIRSAIFITMIIREYSLSFSDFDQERSIFINQNQFIERQCIFH